MNPVVGLLLCWFWLISPLHASPITLLEQPKQMLRGIGHWCETTDPNATPDRPCDYQSSLLTQLPTGFSTAQHWLRFELHNPTDRVLTPWLEVGHPRMQNVRLFREWTNEDGTRHWQHWQTGQDIPSRLRPMIAQRLLLPLVLQPHEIVAFTVRVETHTQLDLSLQLWDLPTYFAKQGKAQIIQAFGMGGLMLAAVFSLMIYTKWRDSAVIWLVASFVTQIMVDASYTGMFSAYFFPLDKAYPIYLHGLLAALSTIFLLLFVRGFLSSGTHYPLEDWILRFCVLVLILTALGFIQWGYALPVRVLALTAIVSMSVSILLFFRAWRDGSGPAGYLLFSYLLLLCMIVYRAAAALGWVGNSPLHALGYSWYFLLVAPTTLLGVLKRAELAHDKLVRTDAERLAQTEFLAQMGHELRSPLNSIMTQAQLIQRMTAQPAASEGICARVTTILGSSKRLLSLIDELLDHSRANAGQIRLCLEPVELGVFLREIAEEGEEAATNVRNRFVLDAPIASVPPLMLDERRLRQILDNLVSNAHRYCHGGVVTLECRVRPASEGQSHLYFAVKDTGPGVAPDEQARIFQPFERGHCGQQSGIDGVGLGLAIARALVKSMGGSLELHSEQGHGAVFFFEITCQNASPSPVVKRRISPKPYRVLVVEDDIESGQALCLLLGQSGFDPVFAASATEACPYRKQPIDIVITDQFMQHGDGWAVLRDWGEDHPVILFSAALPLRPAGFPASLDFHRVLLKPLSFEQVLDAMGALLAIDWEASPISALPMAAPTPDILRPPPDERHALRAWVDLGDVDAISDWQARMIAENPDYRPYCQEVSDALERLDLDRLWRLTD
jgi:two-component system, sensor histidine kinase LadS